MHLNGIRAGKIDLAVVRLHFRHTAGGNRGRKRHAIDGGQLRKVELIDSSCDRRRYDFFTAGRQRPASQTIQRCHGDPARRTAGAVFVVLDDNIAVFLLIRRAQAVFNSEAAGIGLHPQTNRGIACNFQFTGAVALQDGKPVCINTRRGAIQIKNDLLILLENHLSGLCQLLGNGLPVFCGVVFHRHCGLICSYVLSVQSGNRPQHVPAVIAGQLLEAGGVRPPIDLHFYRSDVQGILQFHHILRDLLKTHEFGHANNFGHHALPGIQDLGRLIVGEKGLLCAQLEAVLAGFRPVQGNRDGIFFLSRGAGKKHLFRGERRNVYIFMRAERLPVARSCHIDPAACAAQIAHTHPHFVRRIKDEGLLRPNIFREDGEVRQLTHVL